jgi:ankyrin repeat protein
MNEKEFESICFKIRNNIKQGHSTLLEDFFVNYKDRIHDLFENEVMHVAAQYNNVKAVKMFLDTGISPDACLEGIPEYPPLSAAVDNNSLEVINLLLDAGADIHRKNLGDGNSASYLAMAVSNGNLSLVKFFYERGVDINAEYVLGCTRMNALKRAVIEGYYDIAEYLRSKGAVWIEDSINEPPTPEESIKKTFNEKEFDRLCSNIIYDISQGYCTLLEDFFVNYKDRMHDLFEKGVMHEAAKYNNVKAVKMFLDVGFSPDACRKGQSKRPPLSAAVDNNSLEVINLLLDAGADIHRKNLGDGNSASYLTSAVIDGNLSLVKFFYERGVDINAEYSLGYGTRYNALKWAVFDRHYDIAEYLKSKGAVWIEDSIGEPQTPEESMLQFLSKQFKSKPLPLGLSEIVCVSVPLSVHVFPPKRTRKTTIFVTSGLSEYSLLVPQDKLKYKFAEYILELPGHWEVTSKALEEKRNCLPINWIKAIGRYPHENQTYYDVETKITTEQIPSLKTQDGNDNIAEIKYDSNLDFIVPQDGRTIVFYRLSLPNNPEINKNENKNKNKKSK